MIKQNTPEWLELRKNHIGASDGPIIMGDSPWKTPYQLWQEKLGLAEQPDASWAMRRGTELEPIALEAYNTHTGNNASPVVLFHSKISYMMASLDGLSEDKKIVVEIKCPGKEDHETAKNGKVPAKYKAQLQHQLEVANTDVLHYFSYREGDFALVEVKKDQKYIDKLLKKEAEFWEKMQNLEAPKLTNKDFIEKADQEWAETADDWKCVHARIKDLQNIEKELKKKLIRLSGGESCKGSGVTVQKIIRKGTVDFSLVPELKSVDLEKYRKNPTEMWRIS